MMEVLGGPSRVQARQGTTAAATAAGVSRSSSPEVAPGTTHGPAVAPPRDVPRTAPELAGLLLRRQAVAAWPLSPTAPFGHAMPKQWSEAERTRAETHLRGVVLDQSHGLNVRRQNLLNWFDIQLARLATKPPEARREHHSLAGRAAHLGDILRGRGDEARRAYRADPGRPELGKAIENIDEMFQGLREPWNRVGPALTLLEVFTARIAHWEQQGRVEGLRQKLEIRPPIPFEIMVQILEFVDDPATMSILGQVSRDFRNMTREFLEKHPQVSRDMSYQSLSHKPTKWNLRMNLADVPHVGLGNIGKLLDHLKEVTAEDLRNTRSLSVRYTRQRNVWISTLVEALARVDANGQDSLTTGIVMKDLLPSTAEGCLRAIGRIAEADRSRLHSIEVDFDRSERVNSPLRLHPGMQALARAMDKPGNGLEHVSLGFLPIAADALGPLLAAAAGQNAQLKRLTTRSNEPLPAATVGSLLSSPHNKMRELGLNVRIGSLHDAATLTAALGHEHCRLEAANLSFGGARGTEQALADGLQRALQRPGSTLRELGLFRLHQATPIVRALAETLQTGRPAGLHTLNVGSVQRTLHGIGRHTEPGTLCAAIANPACPLRHLQIKKVTGEQIAMLVEAATQEGSRLASIDLRRNPVHGQPDMAEIRRLHLRKPGLEIRLDGYEPTQRVA